MLTHLPQRQGRGTGTYDDVRSAVSGLLNELGGDVELTAHLFIESGWDKHNDWGDLGDLEKFAASLKRSQTDHPATIGSVIHLACERGNERLGKYKWPQWAKPPLDLSAEDEMARVAKMTVALREYFSKVEDMDTPLERDLAWIRVRDLYKLRKDDLGVIVEHLTRELEPEKTKHTARDASK